MTGGPGAQWTYRHLKARRASIIASDIVTDMHISRIDKIGGQIVPTVIETVRGVDQFLGMDPAEYIKKPRLVNLKGAFAK